MNTHTHTQKNKPGQERERNDRYYCSIKDYLRVFVDVRFERDREFSLKKLKGFVNERFFVVELVNEGLGETEQDDGPSIDDDGEEFGCRCCEERGDEAQGEDFCGICVKVSFRFVIVVAVVNNVSVLLLL